MPREPLDTDTVSWRGREPRGAIAQRIAEGGVDAVARRALGRAGTPIDPNDLCAAAHALAPERVVVTGNVRECQRVHGLGVEGWHAG